MKVKVFFKKEIADEAQSKNVDLDSRVKEVESDAYDWCSERDYYYAGHEIIWD